MKTSFGYHGIPSAFAMLVAACVLFSGCASQPAGQPAPTAAATQAPVPSAATTTAALSHGVSLAVPATWTREDPNTAGLKDYNRTTVTIARFTSPPAIPGDALSSNTLTVDLDQDPAGSFEDYFNQATLAVEKTYDTAESHGIAKSSTLTVSGSKAYELDFQSTGVKGSYLFVSTDKGMYIFAFRGENKPGAVHALEGEITDIIASITIAPSAP